MRYVDANLGEALGQVFVEKTFTPAVKQRTLAMTKEIEAAMEAEIQQLPWMGEATKTTGDREAARRRQQDWISRQMARL